jgi:hypothetical protein
MIKDDTAEDGNTVQRCSGHHGSAKLMQQKQAVCHNLQGQNAGALHADKNGKSAKHGSIAKHFSKDIHKNLSQNL